MIKTDYIFNRKEVSYETLDDGYKIYLDRKEWITQIEPLIPYPELSYEQGCLKQIEEICNPATPEPTETEKRLSALEEENQIFSMTLDDILTNVIPALGESEVN